MANKEISELTSKSTPVGTDEIEIQETGGGSSRKTTLEQVMANVWGASGSDRTLANGNLIIGTSGKGIDFSATSDSSGTATSELLDDYEEGTFTPDFAYSGSNDSYTFNERNGFYTKIGNLVFISIVMSVASGSAGTGNVTVNGLPFSNVDYTGAGNRTPDALTVYGRAGLALGTAGFSLIAKMDDNASTLGLFLWDATDGATNLQGSELSTSSDLKITGFYRTA